MATERHLSVAPLHAVRHLAFSLEFNLNYLTRRARGEAGIGFAKTLLFPGGVWHNENDTQVAAYLAGEEALADGARAATPVLPSAEQRKALKITIVKGE